MVKIKKALVIMVIGLTKVDQTIIKSVKNLEFLLVNYDFFICLLPISEFSSLRMRLSWLLWCLVIHRFFG